MKTLQTGMLWGVMIAFGLVFYGLIHFPNLSTRSVFGINFVLLLYGLFSWRGPAMLFRRPPVLAKAVIFLGLLGGVVLAGEVILEYVFLPADNTRWGLVEFGLVFLLYFIAGAAVAGSRLPLRCSAMAGVATAIISSLIWFIAVLACFHIFFGTPRQWQVFRAEGDYVDFNRSGMTDFHKFIMEDFFGAGFFHLLLGPLIGALLAGVGGLLGMGLARLRRI